jgi:hypothetical protein
MRRSSEKKRTTNNSCTIAGTPLISKLYTAAVRPHGNAVVIACASSCITVCTIYAVTLRYVKTQTETSRQLWTHLTVQTLIKRVTAVQLLDFKNLNLFNQAIPLEKPGPRGTTSDCNTGIAETGIPGSRTFSQYPNTGTETA